MASDIFAKIGDIKGESVDAKHKDEIEVLSFSWDVTHSEAVKTGGGGGGVGKASFHDVVFVHGIDKASPSLLPLAGLAMGDRRVLDVLTRRARAQQARRRLVDAVNENNVVEARLADAATPAAGLDGFGMRHVPAERQDLDFVRVRCLYGLALVVA